MPPEPYGPEGAFTFLNIFFCLSPILLTLIVFLIRYVQRNQTSRVNIVVDGVIAYPESTESDPGKPMQKGRIYTLLEQNPLTLPIMLGGLMMLPLPIISIVTKIIMCNYGLGADLTGVYLLLPVFIVIAVVFGAAAGLVGKGIGLLLDWLTKAQSARVIGTATGSLLAIVAALIIGFFAFAFFMFPDC